MPKTKKPIDIKAPSKILWKLRFKAPKLEIPKIKLPEFKIQELKLKSKKRR
jgi:hypothetical protein